MNSKQLQAARVQQVARVLGNGFKVEPLPSGSVGIRWYAPDGHCVDNALDNDDFVPNGHELKPNAKGSGLNYLLSLMLAAGQKPEQTVTDTKLGSGRLGPPKWMIGEEPSADARVVMRNNESIWADLGKSDSQPTGTAARLAAKVEGLEGALRASNRDRQALIDERDCLRATKEAAEARNERIVSALEKYTEGMAYGTDAMEILEAVRTDKWGKLL